ncbi:WXG100 family type VII secretion target [Streptomyces carpaticus]|uniref:WXG100 family type VII secretion target n=1 Tax=Streptomyces carpaticus TaxID=285558 RepID=A0ABV4ZQQ3_9ACTN
MEDADGYWHTYSGSSATEAQLQAMSHQELEALLRGANPQALMQRGEALESAAEVVGWLGEEIRARADELEWEGQAADAFRTLVRDLSRESAALKTYVTFVGTAITRAGEALQQAKSEMPPAPPMEMPLSLREQATLPTGEQQATLAETEAIRQEAVAAIRRLSSVYELSAWTIQDAPEPQFTVVNPSPVFPGDEGPRPEGSAAGTPPPTGTTPSSVHQEVSRQADPKPVSVTPVWPTTGVTQPSGSAIADGDVGTSLDSVGTLPNSVPPSAPPPPVVERPVVPGGGGPVQQPVVGPAPGWPAPGNPGRGQGPGRGGGGGQVPPTRGPVLRPGEASPGAGRVPAGPSNVPGGQQPPVGRPPYNPGAPGGPGGQQNPLGRPSSTGPGGGNPWGKANNYGLLGGRPGSNAKPTVASRIPPGGVIQPGMNPTNSRLTPTRKTEQPDQPRGTYGKATVDGRTPAGGRGERRRGLPKPTGVIGLPGQTRRTKKNKKKRNESKDDRQS